MRSGAMLTLAVAISLANGAIVAAADAPTNRAVRSADPASVPSGSYVDDPEHTRVMWTVSHHGYSHFFGMFPKVDATLNIDSVHPDKSSLSATVDMTVLGTMVIPASANETFNKILRSDEVFNVEKFPTATFKSTKVTLKDKNKATVEGNLTFVGVTKPATMDVVFNQAGEGPTPGYRVGFDATITIKRLDWGTAGLAGQIGNEVTLNIEAEFMRPKAN